MEQSDINPNQDENLQQKDKLKTELCIGVFEVVLVLVDEVLVLTFVMDTRGLLEVLSLNLARVLRGVPRGNYYTKWQQRDKDPLSP